MKRGLGAVEAGDPAQPAQHVGDVGAEHAAVGVRLVDDHPAEAGEEVAPALVVGQDADVEHVGVGEDQVRAAADRRAVLARGVAVVDRVAKLRQAELGRAFAPGPGRAPWSGRGRARGAVGSRDEPVEHRQVEGQRLARRGAAGDDHVARARRLERLEPGASRAPRSRPRGSAAASCGRERVRERDRLRRSRAPRALSATRRPSARPGSISALPAGRRPRPRRRR